MAEKKSLLSKAQDNATDAAKKGAKEIRSVATEALGAAAAAAAAAAGGVVLDRMAQALEKGKEKVEEVRPAVQIAKAPKPRNKKAKRNKSRPAAKRKTKAKKASPKNQAKKKTNPKKTSKAKGVKKSKKKKSRDR